MALLCPCVMLMSACGENLSCEVILDLVSGYTYELQDLGDDLLSSNCYVVKDASEEVVYYVNIHFYNASISTNNRVRVYRNLQYNNEISILTSDGTTFTNVSHQYRLRVNGVDLSHNYGWENGGGLNNKFIFPVPDASDVTIEITPIEV